MTKERLTLVEPTEEILPEQVRITPDDRVWMEGSFGCVWPDTPQEEQWLEMVNELSVLGSKSVAHMTSEQHMDEREEVLNARRDFINLLPGINLTSFNTVQSIRDKSPEFLVRPITFVQTQRLFWERGLDGCSLINRDGRLLGETHSRLAEWLTYVDALGLDSNRLLNSSTHKLTLAKESIAERLSAMTAVARSAGLADYRRAAIDFANEYPATLSKKTDRIRLLTRIVGSLGLEVGPTGQLQSLMIRTAEASVVTYLEHGSVLRTVDGLIYHAHRNDRNRDKSELRAIIAGHADSDDKVIKAYLRGYPIDDPDAEKQAYVRHLRARDRRREYPPLWPGPALLGNPQTLSAYRAFAAVIDVPELSDEEFSELTAIIAEEQSAEEQRRDFSIRHDEEDIDVLAGKVSRGMEARRALIVRSLGMVVKIAQECGIAGDRAELVSDANAALSVFALNEYEPKDDREREPERFKRLAISAIMRSLIGHAPRFEGKKLVELEARWNREDAAAPEMRMSS